MPSTSGKYWSQKDDIHQPRLIDTSNITWKPSWDIQDRNKRYVEPENEINAIYPTSNITVTYQNNC